MLRRNFKYIIVLLTIMAVGCAKRGNITGGLKDTIAPVLKMSFPKNGSTNFNGKEIELVFNEYIKLENINKQLIVSPPMKKAPDISPQTASKTITIRINDTLQPNTTYSFNFGQSIKDNNEGNPYPQFKYIFSTGSYIDSLALSGVIKDAYNKTADSFVSVMLYEVNDKFNDSVIYKESPRYITNTLDSLKTFKLENLKAGKYLLVAMKDVNSNNKFDPKTDKIGFHKQYVTIPTDTLYELELFKELIPFKAQKPTLDTGNKLLMGYEGNPKGVTAVLKKGDEIVPTIITQFPDKDSLHIWYKPIKADSLSLAVGKDKYSENFTIKLKSQKKDTLGFSADQSRVLPLREKFIITSSRPLVKFDNSLMRLTNKDSVAVPFTTEYDDLNMQVKFDFVKEPLQKYKLQLLPGAMTDFFDKTNDTLTYRMTTKNTSDYGNLRISLDHIRRFPIIVELTDSKGKTVVSEYAEAPLGDPAKQSALIDFNALEPTEYTLRIIYDDNKNKLWDTGSFLEKKQTEEVIYFQKAIDVRSNWDVDQPFTLP